MTDIPMQTASKQISVQEALAKSLKRRHRAEARFKLYGIIAIAIAMVALGTLLYSIGSKGFTALLTTQVELEVYFDPAVIDPSGTGDEAAIFGANYRGLVLKSIRTQFPEVTARRDRLALGKMMSSGAGLQLRQMVLDDPNVIGSTQIVSLPLDDEYDMLRKGFIDRNLPEDDRKVKDRELGWYDQLDAAGAVKTVFNTGFFVNGNSVEPELAGISGAVMGSLFTMLVTLLLSFPVGVSAAIYLEEFAPKNWFTDLIEVNINNLAAVPSIVFGLLGLAVFLSVFGLPRSSALVGGVVLALMTLPTIIIASRAALRAVPPSIREGALGIGASKVQVVTHHVLPLAMPGILTGTIIGMAQALGETAPLLMVGMNAFITDVPGSPLDPAAVMPVQIFMWADRPERAFVEKTSAAILVLLTFLIAMNLIAVLLRKRFERRW
ncbi:MAG: phosphate ABC transporter permease PstA [Pseudomonadota bacterium]